MVHAFTGVDGLKAFKEWVMTPDKDVLEAAQKVRRQPKKPAGDKEGQATSLLQHLKKFKQRSSNLKKREEKYTRANAILFSVQASAPIASAIVLRCSSPAMRIERNCIAK